MPGLAPWLSFSETHLTLRVGGLVARTRRVEAAVLGARAEVAAADLPHQVAAVCEVVLGEAALAGVVGEAARGRAAVERDERVAPDSAPKLIAETLSSAMS